jgi:hypothetical protein
VNLEKLPIWRIAQLLGASADDSLAGIRDVQFWSEEKQNKFKELVQKARSTVKTRQDRVKLVDEFMEKAGIPQNQRNALRRELIPLLELDNPEAGDFVQEIVAALWRGKLVVLDLSLMTIDWGIRLSEAVLEQIFRQNVRGVTQARVINTIAVFEEAQNVLSRKQVEEGRSIFVRWAKEGRKFGLGLIYVTQQPGAIAEEIVSQTDNYFVMHLLNQGDIEALQKANRHYGGVIAWFLSNETIVGNAYVYSAPHQPYIFPTRVFEFSKHFFDSNFGKLDIEQVVRVVHPIVSRTPSRPWKTVVGEAGYKLYELFSKQGLRVSYMDDHNKWIDFSITETLLRGLHRRGLLWIPQLEEEELPASKARGANVEETSDVEDTTWLN